MNSEKFKYLKPESYYSDLYDRCTVDDCRRWEKRGVSKDWTSVKDKGSKKNKIKREFTVKIVIPTALYFIKGERYAQKAEIIRKWMVRDRAKDELLASARPPEVQCLRCGSDLIPNFQDLRDGYPNKKDRVLFIYDCPKGCLPRRAFFDDDEEYRPKPNLCPKCNHVLDRTDKKLENKIRTNYTCSRCDYKEKDELDFSPKKEKIGKDFVKDRERFCLTEEEGREYIEAKIKLEHLSDVLKETKKKVQMQKKLAEIKKLPVAGLQKILGPVLEKEGYIKLEFSKPEIDRDVILQFNVQDSQSTRDEYDSKHRLQKIIRYTLEKANWRLMSEGIYYKLGVLSGRLRGYDSDEDLLRLVK